MKVITLGRKVIEEFFTDNCPQLAASISFYLLFSLFPLTLALISIGGFLLSSPDLEAKFIEGMRNLIPISGDFLTNTIQGVIRARAETGIVAIIGLILGGTSVFSAIRKSLNTAWGIRQSHSFFSARLIELCMMLGASLLILISIFPNIIFGIIREMDLSISLSAYLDIGLLSKLSFTLISVSLAFIVFLFLYKFIPNTMVRWHDVWIEALAAAVCFELIKNLFIWYVSNYSIYNLIYGPVGALIALLTWIYISAVILLFGAKISSVLDRMRQP